MFYIGGTLIYRKNAFGFRCFPSLAPSLVLYYFLEEKIAKRTSNDAL